MQQKSYISLPTLTVRFNLPLRPEQIPQWRGAVAESASWENDRFHNHAPMEVAPMDPDTGSADSNLLTQQKVSTLKDKFHYRYSEINYRVEKGKAAIFAIGKGVEELRRWLLTRNSEFEMGGRTRTLLIESMQENIHQVKMLPRMRMYRLMDYQPMHSENYKKWQAAPNYIARIELLNNILAANILAFASSQDWQLPERLEVDIMNIRETRTVKTHGVKRMAFNLIYKANIDLPAGLSLGRASSFGFGVQQPTREQ